MISGLEEIVNSQKRDQPSEKTFQEIVSAICQLIEEKKLGFWCGAGISKNSGLPDANQLSLAIINKLSIRQQHLGTLVDQKLPLEFYIGLLFDNEDREIVNVFRRGAPNANHFIIGELASRGYVPAVLTTNFDLLLEKAIRTLGRTLGLESDYELVCDERHFINLSQASDNARFTLVKIHGSISNERSIRSSLRVLSSNAFVESRRPALEYMLCNAKIPYVLVLGYSFSDNFDINKLIPTLKKTKCKLLLSDM